jgi:hypothetical protein
MSDPKPAPTTAENLASLARTITQLTTPHSIRSRSLNRESVTHEPLIATLRAKIYGMSGGNGNMSQAEARARTVINADALEQMVTLEGRILDTWRLLIPELIALPQEWSAEYALKHWADLFLPAAAQGQYDDAIIAEVARVYLGWRHVILTAFVTPTVMTITKPCPLCRKVRVIIGQGEEEREVWALLVTLGRTPDYHHATCRNPECTGSWHGGDGIAQLRRDIADLEQIDTAPEGTEGNIHEPGLDNTRNGAPC